MFIVVEHCSVMCPYMVKSIFALINIHMVTLIDQLKPLRKHLLLFDLGACAHLGTKLQTVHMHFGIIDQL